MKELDSERVKEIKKLAGFWSSENSQLAIEQIEKLKSANLERAMKISDSLTQPAESSLAFLNRARGIQIVLDDINAIIEAEKRISNRKGDL